jgi:hypothetical protein
MMRHWPKINGAVMAQFHLLHHWKFPRAGDGAKPRAITPMRRGAPMAHNITRARIPEHPLCASSALPSATLASAPLTTMRIRP